MAKRRIIRLLSKMIGGLHVFLYRRSGGRIWGRWQGGDVLLLTVTGRKSGREWTTPLLYRRDGGDLIVVASNGGMDWLPAWWLNLRAQPTASVQVGRQRLAVRAEPAEGTERTRLWSLWTRQYPRYGIYQQRTTREIPIVKLRPVGETAPT